MKRRKSFVTRLIREKNYFDFFFSRGHHNKVRKKKKTILETYEREIMVCEGANNYWCGQPSHALFEAMQPPQLPTLYNINIRILKMVKQAGSRN